MASLSLLRGLCLLSIATLATVWLWYGQYGLAVVASGWLTFVCVFPSTLLRGKSALVTCIHVWFCLHFLAIFFGWYDTQTYFDKGLHAGVTGVIVMLLLPRFLVLFTARSRRLELLLVLLLSLASAAAWELLEFSVDRTGLFRMQRGLHDTMMDIYAAVIGGLGAYVGMLGYLRMRCALYGCTPPSSGARQS